MASKLYYKLGTLSAFSTIKELETAVKRKQSRKKKKTKLSEIKAWLETQNT
jgi:hypothetical protein